MSNYIAIALIGYVPVVNSDDDVQPGNIGALKKGLEALLSEDSRDNARANALWAEGKALLAEEAEAESGPQAEGIVAVSDDFFMSRVGWGYGEFGYGNWGGW